MNGSIILDEEKPKKDYKKLWRLKNPEKDKINQQKSRLKNKEKRSFYAKKWRAENKEKRSAYDKKYRAENKEKARSQAKLRNAKRYVLLDKKKINARNRELRLEDPE